MAQPSDNPLLSSKPSDSGISVALHPLVLLTASDQITRHRVREETGPVVGILLGQPNGRVITAEHAFSAGVEKDEQTSKLRFKMEWLQDRVQQCV
jgi:COP9 signalosome complex subunit 6